MEQNTSYPEFHVQEDMQKIITFLRNWFFSNGPQAKAVIGISGGKDSSVAAALCVEALGKDRVIGVLMPNGVQSDIDDALCLVKHLGIKYRIVNIGARTMISRQRLTDSTVSTNTNWLPCLWLKDSIHKNTVTNKNAESIITLGVFVYPIQNLSLTHCLPTWTTIFSQTPRPPSLSHEPG